jgi:hypothetical protein
MILKALCIGSLILECSLVAGDWFPKQRFSERRKQMRAKALAVTGVEKSVPATFAKPTSQGWRSRTHAAQSAAAHLVEKVEDAVIFSSSGQQTIIDHGNTFLTISLEIGTQSIKAIPDSGSFELYIVDGADCDLQICKPAYKPNESMRHFTPDVALKKDIYFGSGTCGVELSFDSVEVHNEAKDGLGPGLSLVPLWRIVEMDENLSSVWGDGHGFQGIVGLGFKGNTHKEPSEVLLEEKVVLEAKRKTGVSPTKPGFASKALFGDAFAICLPRGEDAKAVEVLLESGIPTQTDGRLWWGKAVPELNFFSVPVVGTRHWTIKVESASFQYSDDSSKSGSDIIHHMCGGSSKSPCAALVDSGTSLIAMSEDKINEILDKTVIGRLEPDCSNIDEMPDLIFNLDSNGKKLVLSPDAYVMRVSVTEAMNLREKSSGKVVLEKGKVLNIRPPPHHLMELKNSKPRSVTYCTHAFMETPMETALVSGAEHDLIILGIPVFREYTIKFDRARETIGFAAHPFGVTCHSSELAHSSSFAETGKKTRDIRTLSNIHELVFPDEFARI